MFEVAVVIRFYYQDRRLQFRCEVMDCWKDGCDLYKGNTKDHGMNVEDSP